MKNKWNAIQVKSATRWLIATWPELFTPGSDLKPLSLKIHKEILQNTSRPAEVSRRALMEAIKRHTGSFGYLYGLVKSTHRHNLAAEPVELIAPMHKQWAKATLRKRQKVSQASNRGKATMKKPYSQKIARKTTTAPKPVINTRISYRKSRRPLIGKLAQNAVAQALAERKNAAA